MPDTTFCGKRPYTDDARRMADAMNLHAVAKSKGWAVFALLDGRSDQTAYETLDDAHRSTTWRRDDYLYLEIPAGGVNNPAEMQACLDYARALLPVPADSGWGRQQPGRDASVPRLRAGHCTRPATGSPIPATSTRRTGSFPFTSPRL